MAKKDYLYMLYHKRIISSPNILRIMKKKNRPETKTRNPEPKQSQKDWIIWAAWADRVTFEDIFEKTGYTEAKVIKFMRKSLKPSSFRLWRKRAKSKSIKHRKKFELSRKKLKEKLNKTFIKVEKY